MRLDCEFTYVSFGLALQYFVILSVCTVNLFRLFCYLPSIKRRPQKLFLVFASLHAVGTHVSYVASHVVDPRPFPERLLYFALWPPLYQKTPESECQPGTSGAKSDEDATWMNVLGTVPPCFFLSAFSVNVRECRCCLLVTDRRAAGVHVRAHLSHGAGQGTRRRPAAVFHSFSWACTGLSQVPRADRLPAPLQSGYGLSCFMCPTHSLLHASAVYSLTLTAIITDSQDMEYASVWSISSSYFLIVRARASQSCCRQC